MSLVLNRFNIVIIISMPSNRPRISKSILWIPSLQLENEVLNRFYVFWIRGTLFLTSDTDPDDRCLREEQWLDAHGVHLLSSCRRQPDFRSGFIRQESIESRLESSFSGWSKKHLAVDLQQFARFFF